MMIELDAYMARQSCVNTEYRTGLRTHPCGDPVLRIRKSRTRQKVQDPVAQGGVETQGLELNDKFGGYYGVKC